MAASQPLALSLSPNLQVVLLAKILMYEKNYKRSGAVTVYVLDAPEVADAFARLVGDSAKHISIKSVDAGESLPPDHYDLLYLNDFKHLEAAKVWAQKHRGVLVTGRKKLVKHGVTLGTGAEQGRPRFYLNLTASFAAELDWEPRVLTIVGTFR